MVTVNEFVGISVDSGVEKREYEFKGLSTDSKPTECSPNSLFLELDTGDLYYFTGAAWSKVGGAA